MSMWDDAYFYDLATRAFRDDIPYWEAVARRLRPRRILELACGSGRISFPLVAAAADDGSPVDFLGSDSSVPLLDRAEIRLAGTDLKSGVAMRFERDDMRSFERDERFDLIVLGYNAPAYLISPEDRIGCFRAVRQHLAPGGRFAIDTYVPDHALLAEAGQAYPLVRQEMAAIAPAPGVRRFSSAYISRYDPASQTESSTHFWDFFLEDGRVERRVHDLEWHTYFPQELELLAELAGLRVVERFGTYQGAPFDAGAHSYLWIMQGD